MELRVNNIKVTDYNIILLIIVDYEQYSKKIYILRVIFFSKIIITINLKYFYDTLLLW